MKNPLSALLVALATAASTALLLASAGCDKDSFTILNPADPGALYALVVTTDYEVGSFAVIDTEDLSVQQSSQPIHQDAVCRFDPVTATPYVVARLGADAVDVLDPPGGWVISNEYTAGAGSNPQDISVMSESRAVVSRLEDPELLVVNPSSGEQLEVIDLSPYADSDGVPEAAWLLRHDDMVFVAINKLTDFVPAETGSVVVLDSPSALPVAEVELTGSNLYGKLRYSDAVSAITLVEAGRFAELDGGLELLYPSTFSVSGFVITEEDLGGDLVDAIIVSESKGYAIIGLFEEGSADMKTALVSFDPTAGRVSEVLIASEGWDLGFMELSPDGESLWIADRTPTSPGVRIIDVATDEELTDAPLDTGLPPFMICFVDTEASAADVDADADTDTDADADAEYLADTVVDAPGHTGEGFGDSSNAVNGVHGDPAGGNSDDVFSLGYDAGQDSYITLAWSGRKVVNGPGADFAVFENGFFIGGGDTCFMDLVVVYLSNDGENWVPFPHNYTTADEQSYSYLPDDWQGFGGATPVSYNEDTNPVDPFDAEAAGGDHFDLSDLPDDDDPALAIKEEGFSMIKLVTAPTIVNPDTGEVFVSDPMSNGADIDGVMARYFEEE